MPKREAARPKPVPAKAAPAARSAAAGKKHECEETANARVILEHARRTVDAFDEAFSTVRKDRGVTAGAPTDQEQDLLRAALVLAGAGLDSLTKHLIRESLPKLLDIDENVQRGLEEFAARSMKGDVAGEPGPKGIKFLARILAARSQRESLIEEYIRDLTGSSMQSPDQLMKAADALGLDAKACGIDVSELKPIFKSRNDIIHELDIDLTGTRRKRRARTRDKMLVDSTKLLEAGEGLIAGVEKRLETA
jgi:hypothetical protein